MARSNHSIDLLHGQRGVVAILFILCLPVLLGFAALAVDLARLSLTRVELQNAADAAALAGARALNDTQPTPGASDHPYHWSAASTSALDVARRNFANATPIQDATIETGYWNITDPSLGLRAPGTSGAPVSGDLPAVRATVTISIALFFAPVLGISTRNVHASAIAVLPIPGGGTGIFPLVINKVMFDNYWDSATRLPKIDPATGQPYSIDIGSIKFGGISGAWTTFTEHFNDTPSVEHLIQQGNSTSVSVGQNTWIPSGVKEAVFNSVPTNKDVAALVVQNVQEGTSQPIYALAGFHITGVVKNSGKSYIRGHFIENVLLSTANPATVSGVPFGVSSSPLQVE